MEYKASLDQTSKVITSLVTILFLGIMSWNFWLIYATSDPAALISDNIAAIILILSIYSWCYLFRPLYYVVEKKRISIKRPWKDYHLDITKIKQVLLASDESMNGTARTFGVGGLFGYFGKFSNKTFGSMTWFVTQRKNYLILETTNDRKVVLTPDNKDMVKEIEQLMKNK